MNASATDLNEEFKLNTLRRFRHVCLKRTETLGPSCFDYCIHSTA